jgi:calcium-dependent protein kinase
MLKMDPNKRISVGEAIKHPWFQKYYIRQKLPTEKVMEFYRNITSFKIDSKFFFQHATLAYMIHHITSKQDVDEIRKFFAYIDKNGDGRMSYNEVIEGFKKIIPVQEKELLRVFKYMDQGKTGFIEYEGKIQNIKMLYI